MKVNKKWAIIASISVLVIGGSGYYAYAKNSTTTTADQFLMGNVKLGDVTKTVVATGTVQNKNTVNLSFGTAGRLTKIYVQVGDKVKKGQVLAELDQSVLQNQVNSARANLKSAQAKLSLQQKGATSADLASLQASVTRAQADLENAQRNLDTAKQNADTSYLQSQVQIASDQLYTAQSNYDTISKSGDSTQIAMAKAQLDQANKTYSSAISALSNTTQAQTTLLNAENSLRTAQASYDSAVSQLQAKQEPATPEDLAQSQASVEQAQASLATAENNLAQATLTAPFDGTISAITPHEGEQVSGSATVMTIQSDESGLQLVVPIDEADIGLIKVGQPVTATIDSAPNEKYTASVLQVAPAGTTQNNVTTFSVTLGLTGDTSKLKIGQSLTASILIDKRTHVLTVPSEAVRGMGKKHSVLLLEPNTQKPVQTDVEVGLDDGSVVEIQSGLTEGQQVVLGNKSTTSPNTNKAPSVFGGGQRNFGGGASGGGGGTRRAN